MGEDKKVRLIEVVPHDSKWKIDYKKEVDKLSNIYGDEIAEIHHIGSTAIPNIYAKPVIDILIGVKNIHHIDKYNKAMEDIGYIAKGECGIEGRRFFIKGLYNRTHHVHIFEKGNPEIDRHLIFRDYMINHPEEAKAYEELKKELAIKFRYNSTGYCDGKDFFIKNIDKKAKEWSTIK